LNSATNKIYVANEYGVPDLVARRRTEAGGLDLNALDGSITNNMAIVPSTNGKVDAYASGITQLILDISSYFAP
jgi:hypothetical protein